MSEQKGPLTEQERTNLVAYLDGELEGEEARAMEARISLEPAVRKEAEALRKTWELLDFLPRPEPSEHFSERTLSRLGTPPPLPKSQFAARSPISFRPFFWGAGWAAAALFAGVFGYQAVRVFIPGKSYEAELVQDLRIIENKYLYDLVEDLDFLRQLDVPDLFGEEGDGG